MSRYKVLEDFAKEFTSEEIKEVTKLWEKGWSVIDIANVLDFEEFEIVILIMHLDVKGIVKERQGGFNGTVNHDKVTYQSNGMMDSNELYCYSTSYRWTESELEYMCKYIGHTEAQDIALSLGKSRASVYRQLKRMKDKNLFEYYKNLNKHWGA